jgi:peptide/nickel transport system permease protein
MSARRAAEPAPRAWRSWLTTPTPKSRRQAWLGQVFLAWLALLRNPLALLGLAIVMTLVLAAAAAPLLTGHWLGTDEFGRDLWSRVVHGARVTLYIVLLVVVTAPVFGLAVGTAAGYFGGAVGVLLMRLTDIFLAFPRLILALAFVAALGPGIENAVLAIALTAWPPYARVARAETLTVRGSDYIAAARLQGAGSWRIVTGHVMPMCLSSVIVRVTLDMAGIILVAAGLGFLGLGAQPPLPEWGLMISSGRKFLFDQWWVATVPGLAIFVVSLGFNLLGDGLRDVLDPRSASK